MLVDNFLKNSVELIKLLSNLYLAMDILQHKIHILHTFCHILKTCKGKHLKMNIAS